jgi:hypothetical protein
MPGIDRCPSCSGKLSIDDDLRGESVQCPLCRTVFQTERPPAPSAADGPEAGFLMDLSREVPSSSGGPVSPLHEATTAAGFGFVELSRRLDEALGPLVPAPAPSMEEVDLSNSPSEEEVAHFCAAQEINMIPEALPENDLAPPLPAPPESSEGDYLQPCPSCGQQASRGLPRCPSCGKNLRQRGTRGQARARRDWLPDRGGLVLTLGVLSLVSALIFPPIGLPLGIVAWVLGQTDLEKVHRGEMSPTGESDTRGGMVCGVLGTFVGLLVGMGWLVFLVLHWKH